MNFYTEITLMPSYDIGHHFLWEKAFQQIHLALVAVREPNGIVPVGLSLPEYSAQNCQLGSKIRLLSADQKILEKLDVKQWLKRLEDYVHVIGIREIPPNKIQGYVQFQRQQAKSSTERMARRKAKRESLVLEEALKQLNGFQERNTKLPYINMLSLSRDKRFRLFIEKKQAEGSIDKGFSSYGLSRESTVPEF